MIGRSEAVEGLEAPSLWRAAGLRAPGEWSRGWLALLADVDARLPEVEAPEGWWAAATLPLVPAWIEALEAVARSPRRQEVEREVVAPLRDARPVDPDALAWLARHPTAAAALIEAPRWSGEAADRALMPQRQGAEGWDHPASRYVVWLSAQVARALDQAARGAEGSAQAVARARLFELGAARTRALQAIGPLSRVSPARPSAAALGPIIDDPIYGRVHSLGRRLLDPRLAARGSEGGEPWPRLFELWASLSLEGALRRLEGLRWSTRRSEEGERVSVGVWSGRGALTLWSRPGFEALGDLEGDDLEGDDLEGGRRSLSGARRPSLAVTWAPEGGVGRWAVLEVERVCEGGSAPQAVHGHRDALWWGRFGGRPCAGLWIAGEAGSAPEGWREAGFMRRFDLGAFVLGPGEQGADRCAGWLAARLGVGDAV